MAKAAAKSGAKTTAKPRAPRASSSTPSIEKVSEQALKTLRELGIADQLQRDIEWCLGSFRADNNPVGLYEKTGEALEVLKGEKAKKTKGVTAKLITDIEKAIKAGV
jgi:geranylgeranyl pyrophosphate synthase